MKKLGAKIGLALANFGIWIYESNMHEHWDKEDEANLLKLWDLHDYFQAKINGSKK